jgi:hypothetical protein
MKRGIMALEGIADIPAEVGDSVVLPDTDMLINEDLVDATEATKEIDTYCDVIDDAQNKVGQLEEIQTKLGDTLESGGLSVPAAMALSEAVEHIRLKLGGGIKFKFPAMENFGGKMSRKDGTKLTMETIGELASQAWEHIKKMFLALAEMIKVGFKKLFGSKKGLENKLLLLENKSVATESIALEDGSDWPAIKAGPWAKELYNKHNLANKQISSKAIKDSFIEDVLMHGTLNVSKRVKYVLDGLAIFKEALTNDEETSVAIDKNIACFKGLFGTSKDTFVFSYELSETKVNVVCSPEGHALPEVQVLPSDQQDLSSVVFAPATTETIKQLGAVVIKFIKDNEFEKEVDKVNKALTEFIKYADNVAGRYKGVDEVKYKRVDALSKQAYNYTKAALKYFMIISQKEIRMCDAILDYSLASMRSTHQTLKLK